MKIIVVSDTHRIKYAIDKVKVFLNDADVLIHLGDNLEDAEELSKDFHGKVFSVRGNCDFFNELQNIESLIEIEGKKIFICHGHLYGVKYGLDEFYERAKELEADIALYGHTHISNVEFKNGIWFLNPGSPSLPRNNVKTIGKIEVINENIICSIVKISS